MLNRGDYQPEYMPESLQRLECEAVVRLREKGFLLSAGSGGPSPLALAVRDAALAAARTVASADPAAADLLDDPLIEIEVVGPPEEIPTGSNWTEPRAVDPFFEPGIHGLVLVGDRIGHRFCPTELITADVILSDALKQIAQKSHATPDQLGKTRLMRFRTSHWYQAEPGGEIISLERGMKPVPLSAVSPGTLDECVNRLAEYMAYRQQESGLFSYQYEPASNQYTDENNLVRQVGAALAMAVHAKSSGKSASLAAADHAIRFHLQGLTDFPGVDGAAFIATADRTNKLGVTALLALSLAEHPDATQYAETREKLVNGMLTLQRDSGMFVTAFPPAVDVAGQDYFPGEALLAMAVQYREKPGGRLLDAFDRAIGFYREYFKGQPSPAFVPWQVQAYAAIAQPSQRADYMGYVFELTDWLAEKQLNASNCPWPDLWGGIAAHQAGRCGVATASYLEGFADALALARYAKDEKRAAKYERVVREAARFVMQLQVRPEEAYYVRSPQDAVWGIRTSPALNHLRIDHCQHALIALIKTRRVLFPDDR